MQTAVMDALDFDDNDKLDKTEISHMREKLGIQLKYGSTEAGNTPEDDIIQIYASDKASGMLTREETESFLSHWLNDNIAPAHYPPSWMGEPDDFLYGGMWTEVKDWVLQFDHAGVGYVDLWTLMREYGWSYDEMMAYFAQNPGSKDSRWWRSGEITVDVVFRAFDMNENDIISETRFKDDFMPWLIPAKYGIDDRSDDLFKLHKDAADAISKQVAGTIIEEFLFGVLSPVHAEIPFWWDLNDVDLYGTLRPDMKDVVLSHDHDANHKVTLREFLTVIQSPQIDEIIDKYGWDAKWWDNKDIWTDAILSVAQVDGGSDGFLTFEELILSLQIVGQEHNRLHVVDKYGDIHAGGLTHEQFRTFV